MKKTVFLFALFASFISFSQVATKVAQDTGNARLLSLRNSAYLKSTQIGQDTVAKLLRQIRTSLQTGTVPVSVKSATVNTATITALPSGTSALATSANQTTQNTRLLNIMTDINGGFEMEYGFNSLIGDQGLASTIYYTSFSVAPASACTDVVEIRNATVGMHLRKVIIAGSQTTSGKIPISIIARNAINSGGTSTTYSLSPFNANASVPAASGYSVIVYTANPTINNTAHLPIITKLVPINGLTDVTDTNIEFDFATNRVPPPYLTNGITSMCINLNGYTATGGVLWITIWVDKMPIN